MKNYQENDLICIAVVLIGIHFSSKSKRYHRYTVETMIELGLRTLPLPEQLCRRPPEDKFCPPLALPLEGKIKTVTCPSSAYP